MNKRICNKVPQQQFAELILKLNVQKESLTERFQKGLKAAVLARDYGIPETTMRSALRGLGIEIKRKKEPRALDKVGSLFVVVARIAKDLNINHEELLPFLDGKNK